MTAVVERPQVLHTLPGRLRIRVPGWSGNGKYSLETRLRQYEGIQSVQANPLTSNILIRFDSAMTDDQHILEYIGALELEGTSEHQEHQEYREPPQPLPNTIYDRQSNSVRARIAVRGMDHDPALAQRVVERLESWPGVRASASMLTGRVLVEVSDPDAVDIHALIAEVAELEAAPLPEEHTPTDPLDTSLLTQSIMRTTGITLGLGFLATRRALGMLGPLPGAGVALHIASVIGILQGIPFVRNGLRRLLGRTSADLLVNVPGITMLTLAQAPLGLAVAGAESVRLLTEEQGRRSAWQRYEERVSNAPSAQPSAVVRLEAGEQTPLAAHIIEGRGCAIGRDALPQLIGPGMIVPPGTRLYGGPFLVKLRAEETFQSFAPEPHPASETSSWPERYQQVVGLLSFAFAGITALITRSPGQILAALLLVNARPATVGQDVADLGVAARVNRAGATVVGTRSERVIRLPKTLLLDGARLLTHGMELADVLLLRKDITTNDALRYATCVSSAVASPWGRVFKEQRQAEVTEGHYTERSARALVDGTPCALGLIDDWSQLPDAAYLRQRGYYVLALTIGDDQQPVALFALQPRLSQGVAELVEVCQRYGIELAALSCGDEIAMQALVRRTGIVLVEDDAVRVIRARQQSGKVVAFVSDNAGAAAGFAVCDLAIGLTDGRAHLPTRADILAPDVPTIVAILKATALRETAIRDTTIVSAFSNIAGLLFGLRSLNIMQAGRLGAIASLVAIADSWWRLRGGTSAPSTITSLVDPQPERWGRQSVEDVLRALKTSERGLSADGAAERFQKAPQRSRRNRLVALLLEQLNSPLMAMMFAGAGLSLLFGAVGDAAIILGTIGASVAVNIWQERKVNRISDTLQRIGSTQARVLREEQEITISANEVVPGDILLLGSGDRVAADARVISAYNLEIDEAALTGESLPVSKMAEGGTEVNRIVLEGSDVLIGSGRAVVVAVGQQTRMGATRAALAIDDRGPSPLSVRLSRMLNLSVPISCLGGAIVVGAGLLWRQPVSALLATGATIALAGVPEGLPLLAKIGETGVARRLAGEKALVRHLSAVEALGRIDVACADKTGTMTHGRLQLHLVADARREQTLIAEDAPLIPALDHVLLTAALACPHPDAPDARSHPTDVAIMQGAEHSLINGRLHVPRVRELPFDPMRSFHATLLEDRLCLKGAPEVLLPRCTHSRYNGEVFALSERERVALLERSHFFARRGLRVLMVAEGSLDTVLDDPQELTFSGFVGIVDPLRTTVSGAVKRCHAAGVRIIMITGDHPATAEAIAREAGLLNNGGEVLIASELADLSVDELDQRLERTVVVARATPLDKVRIIESLQRKGHTVAMTGDGVNDAPALRLADVGVAVGGGSTEVARQTADVVITDDDFSTLVETLVEGRSFWRNLRSALALLLGGNFAEVALIVATSLMGLATPLTIRQIFAVNAMTDIFPALAVALQHPEHRNLSQLRREGSAMLQRPLFQESVHRGTATMVPALLSYLLMLGQGLPQARSTAFASFVVTQLIQTLDVSRLEGRLTRLVIGALVGSAGVLAAAFSIPPLRAFLHLTPLSLQGWLLVGGGAIVALALKRVLGKAGELSFVRPRYASARAN